MHAESIANKKNAGLKRMAWFFMGFVLISLLSMFVVYTEFVKPPATFPVHNTFTIAEGSSVATITHQLKDADIVSSATLLYFVFITRHDSANLKAGTYNLTEPLDVYEVADLLAQGDYTADLLRITHLEGDSVVKLAARLESMLPDFETAIFIEQATPYEGELFPDTYFIPPSITPTEIIALMRDRYQKTINEYQADISNSELTETEIVILASIIEREANSSTSMKMVSGILQNRLAIGMPLQVDASMEYVLDKPLSELTPADLEQESPYNTYLRTGLPPTAIGNPGLDSILAVLQPTTSDYFYYITGLDGNFYYAETFDIHRSNISRYLR